MEMSISEISLTFDTENVHELCFRLHVLLELAHSDLLAVSATIRRCSVVTMLLLLHSSVYHERLIAWSIANHIRFSRAIAHLWLLLRVG